MFGFLNIAKQRGVTSHDVVNRVRRITGIKRSGHGGTLDPAAEGVLIVALGNACRLLRFLDDSKIYLAEILLGTVTTTDDLEGDVIGGDDSKIADENSIRLELSKFVGEIEQKPPAFSAVHVGGKRLYELARKGEVAPDLSTVPKRTVRVDQIDLLPMIEEKVVRARISCGGGTYIRSIARDLGERLGCGATLKSLVREKAGPFKLEEAITLDALQSLSKDQLSAVLVDPINALATLNVVNLEKLDVERITKGQAIVVAGSSFGFVGPRDGKIENDMVLTTFEGKAVAVCRHHKLNDLDDSQKLEPEVVLNNAV